MKQHFSKSLSYNLTSDEIVSPLLNIFPRSGYCTPRPPPPHSRRRFIPISRDNVSMAYNGHVTKKKYSLMMTTNIDEYDGYVSGIHHSSAVRSTNTTNPRNSRRNRVTNKLNSQKYYRFNLKISSHFIQTYIHMDMDMNCQFNIFSFVLSLPSATASRRTTTVYMFLYLFYYYFYRKKGTPTRIAHPQWNIPNRITMMTFS